jgi:hypothetical protein
VEEPPTGGCPKSATEEANIGPVDSEIDKYSNLMHKQLEERLGLNATALNKILHDYLGLSNKSPVWILRDTSDEEKSGHVECAKHFLKEFEESGSGKFSQSVNGEETCAYLSDPLLKSQSQKWSKVGVAPSKEFMCQKSAGKSEVAIFFPHKIIITIFELQKVVQ